MQLKPLIAITIGILGGIIVAILTQVDFKLGYLHGYLYIILIPAIMYIGLRLYKKTHKDSNFHYMQRLLISIIIYAMMEFSYILFKLLFDNSFRIENTSDQSIKAILLAFAFGIVLSLIIACCFKRNSINIRNN